MTQHKKENVRKPRTIWKRILWQRQPYPDNYTDENFLIALKELKEWRGDPKHPGMITLNEENYAIVRDDFFRFYECAMLISFIYMAFILIYDYKYNPVSITVICNIFVMGLITLVYLLNINKEGFNSDSVKILSAKSSLIIVFTLSVLSPVLKSLSKTTASDSIWTLSFWISITYLWTASPLPTTAQELQKDSNTFRPSNLSTNLLLANMVVLASRLSTTRQVFCFLLTSIQMNVILPRIIVHLNHSIIFILLNMVLFIFFHQTTGIRNTFLIGILCVVFLFVLPEWFIYWQSHYKKFPLGIAIKPHKDQLNPDADHKPMPILTTWDTKKSILD